MGTCLIFFTVDREANGGRGEKVEAVLFVGRAGKQRMFVDMDLHFIITIVIFQ